MVNSKTSSMQIQTQTQTPTLVITADNSVTTWDCLMESKPLVFYPNGDIPISDAAWNHNGQVLASCSALSTDEQEHNNIVLTAAHTGNRLDSLQHNQQWTRPAGAINSLAFGGKSRYLCIGDESGAVCLWDLKKRLRVRQFFHDGHPARQVSLDPTDTYVLSLAPRLFSSYKLREGTMARTLAPPSSTSNSTFTRYHTSTIETNIAAIGTSDGKIHLYDIVDQSYSKPFFSFGASAGARRNHDAYITGLNFSPNNSKLLFASDQEGALTMYDKDSGETVRNIAKLNNSILAMNVHSDGTSVAVGTETGQVLLYDIRQSAPLASVYVEGPVSSLQFAPPPKHKGPSSSSNNKDNTLFQASSSDQKENESGEPVIEKSQTMYSAPYSTASKASQQTGPTDRNVYSGPPPSNKPPSPTTKTASAPKPNTSAVNQRYSAPPPVQPPRQQQKQQQPSPKAKVASAGAPMFAPSLAEIQTAKQNMAQNSDLSTTGARDGGGTGYEGPPASPSMIRQAPTNATTTPNPKPQSAPNKPILAPRLPSVVKQPSPPSNQPNIGSAEQSKTTDTSSGIGNTFNKFIASSAESNMQFSSSAQTGNMVNASQIKIPVDEIRDLVRDEVENLKDDIEEAIRNLHMDMISQFHQQSQELKNTLSMQMATIERLTEENEILREDNDRLKAENQSTTDMS